MLKDQADEQLQFGVPIYPKAVSIQLPNPILGKRASNSALRERESGIWHQIQMHSTNAPSSLRVQNLSRSFEECPRVTRVQHATAWRRARSEKFVEEEEEEEDEADTYSQSARLQFEGVR
ncbi:hypothetical protein GPALN_011491 [Globodera pallida]|nr:hypothetical protein GPALN_011491 [Globodera pallida]